MKFISNNPETKIATVEINGKVREVRSSDWGDNIVLFGLAVKFSSGTKVWPGSATYWKKSGNINNLRPNIDKRGHFYLVGLMEDFPSEAEIISRHNAVR